MSIHVQLSQRQHAARPIEKDGAPIIFKKLSRFYLNQIMIFISLQEYIFVTNNHEEDFNPYPFVVLVASISKDQRR